MTMLADIVDHVIGVDTHKHTHTAAVVAASTGGTLETAQVDTTSSGYGSLVEMADHHDGTRVWAIESTRGYGAGLASHLAAAGEWVIEIDRPVRPKRRNGVKTDQIDAARAAIDALGREHVAEPRKDGDRAALAALIAARRSAVQAAGDAQRQLRAHMVSAPEQIRDRLRTLTPKALLATCAQLRHHHTHDIETTATITVLRSLARRIAALNNEANDHRSAITVIVTNWRPDLLELPGVGPIVAAKLLCAWSHPKRLRNDAAFAMLAGTAPVEASSGKTSRHRLNRGGDRQLNQAIHTIVLCRSRNHPETRAYIARRTEEGKTPREIRRCLKRYVTRQLYRQLEHPPT